MTTDNIVVMLMVGLVIPSVSLCVVCTVIWAKDHVGKWWRNAFGEDVIFIGVTRIATDLAPLMFKLARAYGETLRIRIFGVDGAYFAASTAWLWNWAMRYALRHGVQVEYILCGMTPKAKDGLTQLKRWADGRGCSLRVHLLGTDQPSLDGEAFLVEMRTRHPTLFIGPDDVRAMWLEGKHKAGGTYAYNVRYVPPKAMTGKWKVEFDKQNARMDAIVAVCDEPLAQTTT